MVLCSQPRRCQLQCISRSEVMNTQQPARHFTQFLNGLYFAPDVPKLGQPPVSSVSSFGAQVALSLKASNG